MTKVMKMMIAVRKPLVKDGVTIGWTEGDREMTPEEGREFAKNGFVVIDGVKYQ
jgi:hypothetical protein